MAADFHLRFFAARRTTERMDEPRRPLISLASQALDVTRRWETYASLFYLLLSFPIAIASWVVLVTLLAMGGGLAVTLAGIPLLVASMFLWCSYADVERLLSNTLLRTQIRPLPFGREQELGWSWARLKARLGNRYTWRSLAFLLLVRFPLGVAGFVVLAASLGTAVQLMLAPLQLAFDAEPQLGPWKLDTWAESAAACLLGVALIIPALQLARLSGWLCGRVNVFFLQSPEASTEPTDTALDRAVTSAILWPGVFAERFGGATFRERQLQTRIWSAHFALFAIVTLVLLFINGTATPGRWWVLWPAWGWGILLALHTGYLLKGHLGAHAMAFLATNAGLFIIDSQYSGLTWFFWPLIGWAVALAAHVYVYYGFAPVKPAPALLVYQPFPETGEVALSTANERGIAVDRRMREVRSEGRAVEVTPREFELLALLTAEPGRPFSREELLDCIWKDEYEVTDRTIDTHVQRLRKKLGRSAASIQTVWGFGYRYQP